jgi:hypothetical protein
MCLDVSDYRRELFQKYSRFDRNACALPARSWSRREDFRLKCQKVAEISRTRNSKVSESNNWSNILKITMNNKFVSSYKKTKRGKYAFASACVGWQSSFSCRLRHTDSATENGGHATPVRRR